MLSSSILQIAIEDIKKQHNIDVDITDSKGIICLSNDKKTISHPHSSVCSYLTNRSNTDTKLNSQIIAINIDDEVSYYAYCHQTLSSITAESIRMFLCMTIKYEIERNCLDDLMHANSLLAAQMFMDNTPEFSHIIEANAGRLGYHISHPMAVITAQLFPQYNYCLNMNLGYELAIDEIKKVIVDTLKNHLFFNKQDIFAYVQENYFVIIKNIEEINDLTRLYHMLRKTANILDEVLSKYRVFEYYIAIGRIVNSYHDVHKSFKETTEMIANVKAINLPFNVIKPADIIFSLLASKLPEELQCVQVAPALNTLKSKSPELLLGLFECFENYINNGFCIADTASSLFLHRNTVKKRLEKIKELTGFDPTGSFFDIFMIMIIYQSYKLER